jgi:hypothetical protein
MDLKTISDEVGGPVKEVFADRDRGDVSRS